MYVQRFSFLFKSAGRVQRQFKNSRIPSSGRKIGYCTLPSGFIFTSAYRRCSLWIYLDCKKKGNMVFYENFPMQFETVNDKNLDVSLI